VNKPVVFRHSLFILAVISAVVSASAQAGAPSLSSLKAQGKINPDVEASEPEKSTQKHKKTPPQSPHHQRSSACFQCHTDNQSDQFMQRVRRSCLECHPQGWYTGKLNQLQSGVGEEISQQNQNWPHANGKGPGMSLEMYYEKSRLGDAPNEMVLIGAGDFIRGTNERLPDEGPQHTLKVDAFYIDRYEVTNLQYLKFIQNDGKRELPKLLKGGQVPAGKADHPVTYVSWYDATAYCAWAGKRLPSDIEWEKAARGNDARSFPWGNEFSINNSNSPVRWKELHLIGDTTPVGAFENGKSAYGVYDMSGNVWEWTSSRYEAYPGNTRKSENYGGNYRTLKGGSWWDCSFYQCGISAPVYNRSFFHPKTKNNSFGFRCAKNA